MAKSIKRIEYITNKEAKARLIKFLMTNNCLREYINCYKFYNHTDLTPSEIFDKVIDRLGVYGYTLGSAIYMIELSFEWKGVCDVLCPMHNVAVNCCYSYNYWIKISELFFRKYDNSYVK